MKKLARPLSLILSAFLGISSLFPPVPVFALRVTNVQEAGTEELLLSGLKAAAGSEEGTPSFLPVPESPVGLLLRQGEVPTGPLDGYSLQTARRLHGILNEKMVVPHLLDSFRVSRVPLVELPDVSRGLGVPVLMFRDGATLPTGSFKPRMLAALLDRFFNKDPEGLVPWPAQLPDAEHPWELGSPSTGNHLKALAQFGIFARSKGFPVSVTGFVPRTAPSSKKSEARTNGALVDDRFDDYGQAREAIELKSQEARRTGKPFLYWPHGDRPVILGYMTGAIELYDRIQSNPDLNGKKIAVVVPAGAGGLAAGISAGLTQLMGDRVVVVASETIEVDPLYKAILAGRPVKIAPPDGRVIVDGIAVDQVEPEAFKVIRDRVAAVCVVSEQEALSYTRWLFQDLHHIRIAPGRFVRATEGVTGMSLAAAVKMLAADSPGPLRDVGAVILYETGVNIEKQDIDKVLRADLPPEAAGAEEPADVLIGRAKEIIAPEFQGDRTAAFVELWREIHENPRRDKKHEQLDAAVAALIPDGLAPQVVVALKPELASLRPDLLPDLLAHLTALPQSYNRVAPLDLLLARQLAEAPEEKLRKLFSGERFSLLIPGEWVQEWHLGRGSTPVSVLSLLMDKAGYWNFEYQLVSKNVPRVSLDPKAWRPKALGVTTELQLSFSPHRLRPAAGVEEETAVAEPPQARPAVSAVLWAGGLPAITQVVEGQPETPSVAVELWTRENSEDGKRQLLESMEIQLIAEGEEERPFWVGPVGRRFEGEGYGPHGNNLLLRFPLPSGAQDLLARQGRLKYHLEYRIPGEPEEEWRRADSQGEFVYHPAWLFRHGMTTINVKAWHSPRLPGFEAVRRRLPELAELGEAILLQGIHPGHSVFEIDDFEAADPAMGGEEGLKRLLEEGKKLGIRFIMPWVPGHASDKNPWIQKDPRLFYEVKEAGELPEGQTITVPVNGQQVKFLRGNVFPEGAVSSAEIPDGFGPTVAFNLWSPIARQILSERWERILGKWAQLGFSGFYTDTTHSIQRVLASGHVNEPQWLEGIKARVRRANPGVIFGDEAFWSFDGRLIARGSSFAQSKWIYEELLMELIWGRKNASQIIQTLRSKPLEMMRREVIYWQNHDGNVDPLALHAEWSYRAREDDLAAVMAILQFLGLPGIPSVEIGQLFGDKQKWNVTGNTSQFDKEWNYGFREGAPPREPFDPFAWQDARTQWYLRLYQDLYRIRAGNPALWHPERVEYLDANSPDVFAVYRSAGGRGALVILNLNRSLDPAPNDIFVDLSRLGLSEVAMAEIGNSVENPSLVWPLTGKAGLQGKLEKGLFRVKLLPFSAHVLEFKVPPAAATVLSEAAAGAEERNASVLEAEFPPPELLAADIPVPVAIWEHGGNVIPSHRDVVSTVAFVDNLHDKWSGAGIYADLWGLRSWIPELGQSPGIPQEGTVYLYDTRGALPPKTHERITRILKEKNISVVARISSQGKTWVVPMIPIDAGADKVRFKGWVPAQPEYIGHYRVIVEVVREERFTVRGEQKKREERYRLQEESEFRIHPVRSNGSELRVPPAKKYKIDVSRTGEPVVIGWTPDVVLNAADRRLPVADQSYWIYFYDGRAYVLNEAQMRKYGFPFDPGAPSIRPGHPIVPALIDMDESDCIVMISDGNVFNDADRTLSARLEKGIEVLGLQLPRKQFRPDRDQALELVRRLAQVKTTEGLWAFFHFLDENVGHGHLAALLGTLPPEARDRFLHEVHQKFRQLASSSKRESRVKEVGPDNSGRNTLPTSAPPIVALGLNPVHDLMVTVRKNLLGHPVEGLVIEGGGPLAVARAADNESPGGNTSVVAAGLGPSGQWLFKGLERQGFVDEGRPNIQLDIPGQATRLSLDGALSSNPKVPFVFVERAIQGVIDEMKEHQTPGTLVIGERLIGTDSEDPYAVAKALSGLIRTAHEMGWQTALSTSNSWDAATFREILGARPTIVHVDLENFSRVLGGDYQQLRLRPKEEVAELADEVRQAFGIQHLIISLKTAGEILTTSSGWYAAIPSPALELTYVTGARDAWLGVFLRALQVNAPLEAALHRAVVAEVLHMEGWGRPVTGKAVNHNLHRAKSFKLLQPPGSRPVESSSPEPDTQALPERRDFIHPIPPAPHQQRRPLNIFNVSAPPAELGVWVASAAETATRVVISPAALDQVQGLRRVLEMFSSTRLGDRFMILPDNRMPLDQFLNRMDQIIGQLKGVPEVSVIGIAAPGDPIMGIFEGMILEPGSAQESLGFIFPFSRRGLEELAPFVRQLLFNIGVPAGDATEEAVQRFLSSAGVEEAA